MTTDFFVLPKEDQAIETDMLVADDVFAKSILVPKEDTYVPQHSHRYDHATLVAHGAVDVWVNGEYRGIFKAPEIIMIQAGTKHLFRTLEDDTVIVCIHNASRPDVAAVVEEHRPMDLSTKNV